MIKFSVVLLFVSAFIIVLIYYRFPAWSVLRSVQYVGTSHCAGCHGAPGRGDQYDVWLQSAHARAYIALLKPAAILYAEHYRRPAPAHDPVCLHCHTTAPDAPATRLASSYNVEEGVTCEACHGPGSEYSADFAMQNKSVFVKLGGVVGSERQCMQCHAESLNESHCPFQTAPFDAAQAMRVIAHPFPRAAAKQ